MTRSADSADSSGASEYDLEARSGAEAPSSKETKLGPDSVSAETYEQLLAMRSSIDNIDAALIHLLAERFKATQRVGVLKAEHQLPAADPAREQNQIARLKALAEQAHLDPGFAEKFLNFIIEEVIRHHQAISSTTSSSQIRS